MDNINSLALARIVHVIGVVLWIGGVAFVTTVLLGTLRDIPDAARRLELFERLEGRFAFQARIVTLFTGLSGFYMLHLLNGWERYHQPQFWWLHLMTFVWALFTIVLFVAEPLFLHRWFRKHAEQDSETTFARIHRMHRILLGLSLLAVAGGAGGSHGLSFF